MREQLNYRRPLRGNAWRYRAHPRARRDSHTHDDLEFNLITAGRASYLIRGTRHDLRPATLIWLYPDHEHVLVGESSDFAMWVVVIRPRWLGTICHTAETRPLLKTDPSGPVARSLAGAHAAKLEHLLNDLAAASHDVARFNAGVGYAVLEAWRAFQQADRNVTTTGVHPAVERAAWLIRQRDPSLDLPALARQCGLSADRLGRLFRRQTGVSLTDYRNRARLDHFLQRYGRGEGMNMTAAALAAGFGSYAQFHRVFRNLMNGSPADYRRRIRND